jgi:hypothetical protein
MMHQYATDSDERKNILFLLVVISLLSAWFLNEIVLNQILNRSLFWWLEAPAVFGLFGLFYGVFDRYLWKKPIFHKIRLIRIPDLNGIWKGYISSSFKPDVPRENVEVEINQSWTKIGISLRTGSSRSHSLTASVLTKDQNNILISYEYLNEPKYKAESSMHTHRGTCRLVLSPDRQRLEGEYYTGRDRQNFGTLSLKKLKQ